MLPAEGRVLDGEWVDSLAAHPGVAWAGGVLEQDVVVRRQGEPVVAPCSVVDVDHADQTGLAGSARGVEMHFGPTPSERLADMSGWAWPASCAFPSVPMPHPPDGQRPKAGTTTGSARGSSLLDGGADRCWSPAGCRLWHSASTPTSMRATSSRPWISPKTCSNGPGLRCPGWNWCPAPAGARRIATSIDARWPESVQDPPREERLIHSPAAREMGHVCHPQLHPRSWRPSTSSPP